jgi:hypothetical protein
VVEELVAVLLATTVVLTVVLLATTVALTAAVALTTAVLLATMVLFAVEVELVDVVAAAVVVLLVLEAATVDVASPVRYLKAFKSLLPPVAESGYAKELGSGVTGRAAVVSDVVVATGAGAALGGVTLLEAINVGKSTPVMTNFLVTSS